MATLAEQLQAVTTNFKQNAPASVVETITAAQQDVSKLFADTSKTLQVGAKFPSFSLPSAAGTKVSSDELLSKGLILVTFYRGNWCPFCNLALRGYQKHLDKIHAKGVEFVAISPELPDNSLDTKQKNELEYPVLSDVGNKLARQLGIVWKQPDSMGPVLKQFGHDLEKQNGDDSLEVPLPATFLVGKDGVVKNVFVEADYTQRLEPTTALEWIDQI
ncbi:AhpC-TSA-domain-containing protein [Lophiostoma macrostomum CBS 122681]|uniref:thioredoxin-dependent peroxiredoxin n=1 Tax=Lophiostoma macrostomum CBS 122681 TaxID=1314788 RepID=A0A6A6T751_9PLEO|nr:AhpC-TSA-domain-containing protein [Lophiostoma macrostomum CBS 122681]